MKKEPKPKRPPVVYCAICGKEIRGNYEANKTRRGTVIYFHRHCMKGGRPDAHPEETKM